MSSNSVCNHTRDKQIGLPLRGRHSVNHSYDYRANWKPVSPVTINYDNNNDNDNDNDNDNSSDNNSDFLDIIP